MPPTGCRLLRRCAAARELFLIVIHMLQSILTFIHVFVHAFTLHAFACLFVCSLHIYFHVILLGFIKRSLKA